MNLKDILSISGYPDLYKLVAQARSGIIVESLITKKRMQAFASSRISSLEDIAVFTETEEITLKQVFLQMYKVQEGKTALSPKSPSKDIKIFFEKAVPDYDKEKVYTSDMKRMIKWYNLLVGKELVDFTEEEEKKDEKDDEKVTEKEKNEIKDEKAEVKDEKENVKEEKQTAEKENVKEEKQTEDKTVKKED